MSGNAAVGLGEVAEFIRGINFKPEDVVAVGEPGTVACMRTKNVQSQLDLQDVWGVPERFVRREEQVLREGDILVSSANSWNLVGKCCPIPTLPWKASFGGFVSVLRTKSTHVNARYLYHWFASDSVQALLRSFGQKTTNISNLNIGRCLAMELPLPSLAEQHRIASILDLAKKLQVKRREMIDNLDRFGRAIFLDMFGDPATNPRQWPCANLGNLVADGFQNGLYKHASEYGSGTPILRIDAFYDGMVTGLETLKRVRVSKAEGELFGLCDGDVIINRVNSMEYLGKSAIVPVLSEPVVFESNMMRFRVDSKLVLPAYVVAFLQTDFVKRQIRMAAKRAVNQASINQKDVAAFQVNVPPLANQQKFVKLIHLMERLKSVHRASLVNFEKLFNVLQQRAFRGEL